MLWHGVRAPAVAGVGRQPVSIGTLPTRVPAAQPGPRVGRTDQRHADAVPDSPLRRAAALAAQDRGGAAAALAGRLQADGVDLLPGLARLRAEVGAEHAGPAWELARLRARARPVFGADADVLLLTADALEQAGRPELAARRAARLLAGGATSVADLGCAAGTDTVALARAGASVVAVDRDPVARALTAANAEALGLADRVRVVDADVVDLVAAADGAPGCAAARSTRPPGGGRRQLDPDRWSPPWSTVTRAARPVPTAVVKVAPGLDHDRVPDGVEAEWVSVGGSIVEALLWGRGLSTTWRRATLVRDGSVLELTADADPGPRRSEPVRGWLHEPDPAVIRSGLVSLVAADLGATLVDPTIAYLTSDARADSPWVSSYRVIDVLPFNLKKLKALLRAAASGASSSRSGARRSSRRPWPGS